MDLDADVSLLSTSSASSTASLSTDIDTDSIFTAPQDAVSTTATSRHTSDEPPPPPQITFPPLPHNPLRNIRADITSLRKQLKDLTVEATRQLQDQPRATQLALSKQTRELFGEYGRHGSEARLSWGMWEFLNAGEDIRRGGEMVFWGFEEGVKMKMKGDGGGANEERESEGAVAMEGGETAWEDVDESTMETPKKPVKGHPNRKFRINTEVDATASVGLDFLDPSRVETFLPAPKSTPTSVSPPPAPASYTNDPDSTALLCTLPFHPVDIVFTFPSYTAFPNSPQTYLTHMNNIVKLHNCLANAVLSHHDTKYLSLALNTPEDVRRLEHGYTVLRGGIGEMIRDRVTEMFGSADEDEFGLTTETRGFLKDVYDGNELGVAVSSGLRNPVSGTPKKTGLAEGGVVHQVIPVVDFMGEGEAFSRGPVVSGRGKLSGMEEAMVARVARVPVGGVREWWEERKMGRLPVVGMRAWIAARELERGRRAREEGRYWGWEKWSEEEWEVYDGGMKGDGDVEWEGEGEQDVVGEVSE